jgi:transaldolase
MNQLPLYAKPLTPRRTPIVGPLLAALIVGCVLTAPWTFVGVPVQSAPLNRHPAAHVEDIENLSAPSSATIDSSVGATPGLMVGLLASVAGVAAAVTGAGRVQKSMSQQRMKSRVTMCAGTSALDQLRTMTTVVADTGILEDIKKYRPEDATTNPTLVLRALSGPDAKSYFDNAIAWSASAGHDISKTDSEELVTDICDRLAVLLGCDILKYVPGVVSTEVDARLSFDADAMVAKGRTLSKLYQEQGYGKDRVLIKLASTWEAMIACKQLEAEGIHTNMTLVLSLPQAVAAAEAGATLISPFVGRILDWWKKSQNRDYKPEEDPGVLSVRQIFSYYKKFGYETIVMGASFRSAPEILALAGCDKMTISPGLLEDLDKLHVSVQRRLDPAGRHDAEHLEEGGLSENGFRWHLNENAMATELLGSGIRAFAVDGKKLEDLVRERLAAAH